MVKVMGIKEKYIELHKNGTCFLLEYTVAMGPQSVI